MSDDDLSPAESARAKRRDRDASARHRALMRTGLAKQFHTINQVIVERAASLAATRKRKRKAR